MLSRAARSPEPMRTTGRLLRQLVEAELEGAAPGVVAHLHQPVAGLVKDLKARGLIVAWDTRVVESWAAGSRLVNCKVGALPADNVLVAWEGSVRNPNAPPLTTSNPPQTTAVEQDEPTGAPLHSQSNSSSAAPPSSSDAKPPKSDETTTTPTTTTTR